MGWQAAFVASWLFAAAADATDDGPVVAVESKAPAEAKRPVGVPADAQVLFPLPTVRVYHWVRPEEGRDLKRVYVFPVIDEWQDDVWGAEVEITPIPFCCGAKKMQLRWRKSQTPRPTIISMIPTESQYELRFEFRSMKCNCR